jgi:uncharacterized protein
LSAAVLVDTGPLVAILSQADQHHAVCVEQLRRIRGRLITCWPVITEAAWLLRAYPLAVQRLLVSFGGNPFELAALDERDLPEIVGILTAYKNLKLQLADAALVRLATREKLHTIFTLDRRDFGIVRLAGGRRFQIIP